MPEWARSSQRPCTVDPKMPMKILSHYPPVPPFIKSCDTKSFPETFLTKIKASKCSAKEKKWLKKSERKQEVKEKLKVETAVSLLNPNPQICYLYILKLGKLILLLENIRRPRSAQPINGILGSFGSVWPDSDWISFWKLFQAKFPKENGLINTSCKGHLSHRYTCKMTQAQVYNSLIADSGLQWKCHTINNLLTLSVQFLQGNLRPWPWCVDQYMYIKTLVWDFPVMTSPSVNKWYVIEL